MRRAISIFLGRVVPHATVACLLALGNGCRTEVQAPGDLTGSGGSGSTSGSGGTQTGVGGEVGSGGAPTDGSGASDAGGSPSGGTLGSGGVPATGGASATGGSAGSSGGAGGTTLSLTSPALENVEGCATDNAGVCEVFPDENVSYMEHANVSPELHWTGVPEGSQSFAVVLFDVTFGQAHWVLWNIPAEEVMLAANVPQDVKMPATPAGSEQANANFADTSTDGYFGPHVPCNVFEVQLFALALPTFTPADPDSAVLVHIELQELGDAVLGQARLTGRAAEYDVTCP
jgi:phosphatidylethanolamine-binding protein (PEBP) family uncharacterized protein